MKQWKRGQIVLGALLSSHSPAAQFSLCGLPASARLQQLDHGVATDVQPTQGFRYRSRERGSSSRSVERRARHPPIVSVPFGIMPSEQVSVSRFYTIGAWPATFSCWFSAPLSGAFVLG